MSRLRRTIAPSIFDLIPKEKEDSPKPCPQQIIEILVPWPNLETKIKVPAKVNWVKRINETDLHIGITFYGRYPYDIDCSSIYLAKEVDGKLIPIKSLLN